MEETAQKTQQPIITKHQQMHRGGIQLYSLSRHAIGYVLKGKKYIYYGDTRHEINRGELFYLNIGNHYIEDVPEDGKPYEQIMFYYSTEMLGEILTTLSINYHMEISNTHVCPNCSDKSHVIYPAWGTMKNFFNGVNQYLKEDIFSHEPTAEKLKTTELIYLIITHPDCCIKSKILNNMDISNENFEQTIRQHIFDDIGIEKLAALCNKSLTSFKKEFRKQFHEPPHKWLIKRRLIHSRLLLLSTNKSISEIGNACNFPNTSHYIKLFKKEYGLTPAAYRNHIREETHDKVEKIQVTSTHEK